MYYFPSEDAAAGSTRRNTLTLSWAGDSSIWPSKFTMPRFFAAFSVPTYIREKTYILFQLHRCTTAAAVKMALTLDRRGLHN